MDSVFWGASLGGKECDAILIPQWLWDADVALTTVHQAFTQVAK